MKDQLSGALTGIAVAAAAHWARYDDDSQRRLRNVRMDAEEALDQIRQMQSHGEQIRSRLPVLMDAQVGIALANPQPAAPAIVPSTVPMSRPDLASQMETAVSDMSWPPEPGQYDDRGLIKQTGELTSLFLALTYEEVRAFLQGLPQSRSPGPEAKTQIFYAANALIAQLVGQKLTWQQYKDVWARLFGGGSTGSATGTGQTPPTAVVDPHQDPARPPIIAVLGNGVASVVPLSSLSIAGYPFVNRNTDAAIRLRITSGGAPINAGSNIVQMQFGAEYRYRDANGTLVAFQPTAALSSTGNRLYIENITSTGFSIYNSSQLQAASVTDAYIIVCAGQRTEV